ncbi:MAG: mercuric transporter MerT family protein [Candidatus Glassbacteria bacterium]
MATSNKQLQKEGHNWGLIGAMSAAVFASLCCLGPLVLLVLGISGAWIGNLTALEPYRPIFMVVTLGFLGVAFYKVYETPKEKACEPGSYCASPHAGKRNKVILWIATILIAGLLSIPSILPYLSAGNTEPEYAPTVETVLEVQNMTCASCVVTVRKSLTRLDGVKEAAVTLNPPRAVVIYDPRVVSAEDLIEATTNAGYPSDIRTEGGE